MSRSFVVVASSSAALLAAILVTAQAPFHAAAFDYGISVQQSGLVEFFPFPVLNQDGQLTPLVAQGKFGADGLLGKFRGDAIRIESTAIQRGEIRMWEVSQARAMQAELRQTLTATTQEAKDVIAFGEIVDGKCWLGVMNPGAGRVHRECAYRCLSGGVPPLFITREGNAYWLIDAKREMFPKDISASFSGLRVRLNGSILQRANLRFFTADPSSIRRE